VECDGPATIDRDAAARGTSTLKREPKPGSESMRTGCASNAANLRMIASPRPMPSLPERLGAPI